MSFAGLSFSNIIFSSLWIWYFGRGSHGWKDYMGIRTKASKKQWLSSGQTVFYTDHSKMMGLKIMDFLKKSLEPMWHSGKRTAQKEKNGLCSLTTSLQRTMENLLSLCVTQFPHVNSVGKNVLRFLHDVIRITSITFVPFKMKAVFEELHSELYI